MSAGPAARFPAGVIMPRLHALFRCTLRVTFTVLMFSAPARCSLSVVTVTRVLRGDAPKTTVKVARARASSLQGQKRRHERVHRTVPNDHEVISFTA